MQRAIVHSTCKHWVIGNLPERIRCQPIRPTRSVCMFWLHECDCRCEICLLMLQMRRNQSLNAGEASEWPSKQRRPNQKIDKTFTRERVVNMHACGAGTGIQERFPGQPISPLKIERGNSTVNPNQKITHLRNVNWAYTSFASEMANNVARRSYPISDILFLSSEKTVTRHQKQKIDETSKNIKCKTYKYQELNGQHFFKTFTNHNSVWYCK